MSWSLRYAPHLGYRPPFQPLFAATVGSDDPLEQIRFAADNGFAGVLYAAARARPPAEQQRVGEALAAHGLEPGCILYTSFDNLRNTSWATDSVQAREWIAVELAQAKAALNKPKGLRITLKVSHENNHFTAHTNNKKLDISRTLT